MAACKDGQVSRILEERIVRGKKQYLVEFEASWIPAEKLQCDAALMEYYAKKNQEKAENDAPLETTEGVHVKQSSIKVRSRGLSYVANLGDRGRAKSAAPLKVRFASPSPAKGARQVAEGRGRRCKKEQQPVPKVLKVKTAAHKKNKCDNVS